MSEAIDNFQYTGAHALAPEHDAISAMLEEERDSRLSDWTTTYDVRKMEHARIILATEPAIQVRYVMALAERLSHCQKRIRQLPDEDHRQQTKSWEEVARPHAVLHTVLDLLMHRKLPLGTAEVSGVLDWLDARDAWIYPVSYRQSISNVFRAIGNIAGEVTSEVPFQARVKKMRDRLRENKDRVSLKLAMGLEKCLGTAPTVPIKPGEAWADEALAFLEAASSASKGAWIALLDQCQTTSGGQPNAKWVKTATQMIEAIGHAEFKASILCWFPPVDKPRTAPAKWSWQPHPLAICDPNMDILRGLAWCCSFQEDRELARALTALAVSAYKKIPGIGPRAVRVGNACVWALGNMPGLDAVGQLALLRVKVKFGTAQKGIEKALAAAAKRVNLSPEELEELSVPSYGLSKVGLRIEKLGEFSAELRVDASDVELAWRRADGKTIASVPAALKVNHAEELKELKAAKADIEKMIPALRERLDALFLQRKQWPFAVWRERYLDHALVGTLARRLIWRFTLDKSTGAGIYFSGEIVGSDGRPVAAASDRGTVELWHPLNESPEAVQAWRSWLEEREVRQPFKQAHREIYILTDAERRTRTYSNRFAAHIIKQHQFNALCGVRSWKNKLRLLVDDSYPPAQRLLPQWNLRAEYWVEGIGANYGQDTNDAGVFLYLSTDQVRFYALDTQPSSQHASGGQYHPSSDDPIPLENIPPLVFSEVMRDVDLFVGVCSVGNDPNWADNAREGPQQTYWREYSFGNLSESAKTRKQLLARLLPRLKIGSRCSFDERFLIVAGDIRRYKIHLGSGNILMEPNDQYLCIVPKQSASAGSADAKVFLPFEGDNTLSVILSKAFLLAEDGKIRDQSIVNQIKR